MVVESKRHLKSSYAYQASYQVLLIAVPLITTPYLSRVLGAEAIGVYSYAYTIAGFFAIFATLGIGNYGVRAIAATGDDRSLRSHVFWSVYASQCLAGLIVCLAYVVYLFEFDSAGGFVVAATWGMYVLSALLDVSWLLFGMQEFKVPTIRSVVTKLATLPLIFGLIHGSDDVWIYCAAIAGSFLVNQLLIWPFVHRYVDFVVPQWKEVKEHFYPSLILFIPVLAISLYTTLDKILLGELAGMQQAGFFEYSEKLSKMPLAIVTAVGAVMLPRITEELAAERHERAMRLLSDSVWAMMAMAMAMAFGIAAIAPEFASVFLGEEFTRCSIIMRVLAVIIPIISLSDVIGRQYMVPMERDVGYTISLCIGAVVNIGVNLALIPDMGAMGAAIAAVVAEFTVLVAQAFMVRDDLPLGHYVLNAIPFMICGIVMFFVVRFVARWFYSMWGFSVLGLVLEIAVGGVVFSALAFAWCFVSGNSQFRRLTSWKA